MAENTMPVVGGFYRHFKNRLYQVLHLAVDANTEEQLVVYQALYGDFKVYVRPLKEFISEVDHEKYPDVQQKFRFVKVVLRRAEQVPAEAADHSEKMCHEKNGKTTGQDRQNEQPNTGKYGVDDGAGQADGLWQQNAGNGVTQGRIPIAENKGQSRTGDSPSSESFASSQNTDAEHAESEDSEDIGTVHPLLMKFLDAETYDQRLGIFDEMEGIADMHMLNAVAASLDVTLGDTTIEEAFSLIRDNLATQKKYECSRWR